MTDLALRVENLGKQYRIGAAQKRHSTLRDAISDFRFQISDLLRFNRKSEIENRKSQDTIWALKDVSFDVKRGEVVGIIGRNGAGKSTLLKILSSITKPTEGRVTLNGRVGSLLEVGTGFHAELTGRENIFLNGAILGMGKREIERKFDEMVAFAEVEKFIDTPVKHYSSGMYVRLAFAVAAHLEPEILVVDEVLAVGDAQFQKKCLGKMGDVAKEGRTVLFVSHNMQAVTSLCTRGIQLAEGKLTRDSDALMAVREYMMTSASESGEVVWGDLTTAPGDDLFRLRAVRLIGRNGQPSMRFQSGESIRVRMEFDLAQVNSALVIGFDLTTPEGVTVMRCYHNDSAEKNWPPLHIGRNCIESQLPASLLNAGSFVISPRVSLHCVRWILKLDSVVLFEVELTHGVSPFWNVVNSRNRPGVIAPIISWVAVN
ncbi:MAG: ABC transporter ATP-binding protein [Chloroflexi bacterium]|nr:ABC transporter ATP-binding protein [Chloroflexota bacterium]